MHSDGNIQTESKKKQIVYNFSTAAYTQIALFLCLVVFFSFFFGGVPCWMHTFPFLMYSTKIANSAFLLLAPAICAICARDRDAAPQTKTKFVYFRYRLAHLTLLIIATKKWDFIVYEITIAPRFRGFYRSCCNAKNIVHRGCSVVFIHKKPRAKQWYA